MKIEARILADSVCRTRLTTFLVTYPRIILAEVNTHCILPKNSASSRAIPVSKRIEQVLADPYVPAHVGGNQRGMQATEDEVAEAKLARDEWLEARDNAVRAARRLADLGVHKQLANRVLEPYVYTSTVLTGTEWANFFNLRVHEDAQPEFCELAYRMLEAYVNSTPSKLQHGEWHLPFGDRAMGEGFTNALQTSAARCARLSYDSHDGNHSLEKDLDLAGGLQGNGHMSPFQHQAQAVDANTWWDGEDPNGSTLMGEVLQEERASWDGESIWWGQLRWWRMYRKTLQGENRSDLDVGALLVKGLRLSKARGFSP